MQPVQYTRRPKPLHSTGLYQSQAELLSNEYGRSTRSPKRSRTICHSLSRSRAVVALIAAARPSAATSFGQTSGNFANRLGQNWLTDAPPHASQMPPNARKTTLLHHSADVGKELLILGRWFESSSGSQFEDEAGQAVSLTGFVVSGAGATFFPQLRHCRSNLRPPDLPAPRHRNLPSATARPAEFARDLTAR